MVWTFKVDQGKRVLTQQHFKLLREDFIKSFQKKVGNFHDLGGGGGKNCSEKNVPYVAKSLNN